MTAERGERSQRRNELFGSSVLKLQAGSRGESSSELSTRGTLHRISRPGTCAEKHAHVCDNVALPDDARRHQAYTGAAKLKVLSTSIAADD